MCQIVENILSRNVQRSLKKIPVDPKADDFLNLISSFFSKYIYGKNFHEDPVSSFYVKLLTYKHTDKRNVKHNLLCGGIEVITDS